MSEWIVERLNRTHDRTAFSCGHGSLDSFLHTLVSQYEKRRLGRTYVALHGNDNRVLGYYTLASGAVPFEHLPQRAKKRLPRHPVPVILLARLAVDQSIQGQGLGRFLIVNALRRCMTLSEQLGVHAIEVDAVDGKAQAFYQRYGFVALQDNPLHLYLLISTIVESDRDD